jgi:hypothetical protein
MHNLLNEQGWVNQHASQLTGPETHGYYAKLQILGQMVVHEFQLQQVIDFSRLKVEVSRLTFKG